ncbi:uncharacterized protein AMSG_09406 [Thecamonas trahens ATCC 50062]|uniref:Regulator of microtubule dynamics protein 1 n=1 Tax=Thecamonas trahens ATCC 50062 TaxID=461836 RepID=A0A0L0DNX2_THETB|nr:hypothetical protein AMSG_09406 [Thecamonas trahens ATCC 50062]KNC53103.1 hypothetical protein AMSG_09406 [Thecamonas trahens ATCC 50062]|eukprot:XP_013754771.1 hypothetical protein AMSG_09406 [Thecamonas trahens ATCC 50062]
MSTGDLSYETLDHMFDNSEYQELYTRLEAELTITSAAQAEAGESDSEEDVELLWRFARVCYSMHTENKADKKAAEAYLRLAIDAAKQGMRLDEGHFAPHKWYAIALGGLGGYVSTKEKIGYAYEIREHADKALELKPGDSATLHLIGRWCFDVAGIGWATRKIASMLFATPPESSFDEALTFFEQARDALPDDAKNTFPENDLFIGNTLLKLSRKADARAAFQAAVDAPIKGADGQRIHDEAAKQL